MSAPAFTAGPWLIHAKHRWIVPAEDAFKRPDDALPICQLRDPDERLTEDETLANGFLIAAAPELYEALAEIAKGEGAFNRDPLIHAENTIESMKEIAIAALAKAKGQ